MVLRERRSPNFHVMQEDAIYVEGNMISLRKMKKKHDQAEKKKAREDCGTSNQVETPKKKIWMKCID
jgi:hypothetical protein